jgi:hypothetical protein
VQFLVLFAEKKPVENANGKIKVALNSEACYQRRRQSNSIVAMPSTIGEIKTAQLHYTLRRTSIVNFFVCTNVSSALFSLRSPWQKPTLNCFSLRVIAKLFPK